MTDPMPEPAPQGEDALLGVIDPQPEPLQDAAQDDAEPTP